METTESMRALADRKCPTCGGEPIMIEIAREDAADWEIPTSTGARLPLLNEPLEGEPLGINYGSCPDCKTGWLFDTLRVECPCITDANLIIQCRTCITKTGSQAETHGNWCELCQGSGSVLPPEASWVGLLMEILLTHPDVIDIGVAFHKDGAYVRVFPEKGFSAIYRGPTLVAALAAAVEKL